MGITRKWQQMWKTLLMSSTTKSYMLFRFIYLNLSLGDSKGQGRAYLNFDYLVNGYMLYKLYHCHRI